VSWDDLDVCYVDGLELEQFLLLGSSKTSLLPSFPNKIRGSFRAKLKFRPNSAQVVLISLRQLLIFCFITTGGRELIVALNKVSQAL